MILWFHESPEFFREKFRHFFQFNYGQDVILDVYIHRQTFLTHHYGLSFSIWVHKINKYQKVFIDFYLPRVFFRKLQLNKFIKSAPDRGFLYLPTHANDSSVWKPCGADSINKNVETDRKQTVGMYVQRQCLCLKKPNRTTLWTRKKTFYIKPIAQRSFNDSNLFFVISNYSNRCCLQMYLHM
jgi:hypothetical protein